MLSEVFIVYGQQKRRRWFGYHLPSIYRICSTREAAERVTLEGWLVTTKFYIVAHSVEG